VIRLVYGRGDEMGQQELEVALQEQLKIVYYYLLKMGAKPEDAEDIVQDTAYKFLLYIDSIPIRNSEGWLFRVAVNGFYDLSKTRSRREKIVWRYYDEDRVENKTPETTFLASEMSEEIRSVLDQLKPHYKEVLLLKYAADLSLREMADMLDMKETSVKSTLHRARASFSKRYGRDNNE